jgi:N-acetylmuramoyl-L-alanine amidase
MPISPLIQFDSSPHFSDRNGHDIVATIIHFTAGASAGSSIAWSKNVQSQASWHFIIDRDGFVSQQVDLAKAAWHAGAAEISYKGRVTNAVNSCTIGIELANQGLLHRNVDGSFGVESGNNVTPYRGQIPVEAELVYSSGLTVSGFWEPFAEPQILRLEWLLDLISKSYGAATKTLFGHEEVAVPPGRKMDPGPVFPWARFGRSDGTRLTQSHILTQAPPIA